MIVDAMIAQHHRYRVHHAHTHEMLNNVRWADSLAQRLEYYSEDGALTVADGVPFYIVDTATGKRVAG